MREGNSRVIVTILLRKWVERNSGRVLYPLQSMGEVLSTGETLLLGHRRTNSHNRRIRGRPQTLGESDIVYLA
jgi:hypothetical protein